MEWNLVTIVAVVGAAAALLTALLMLPTAIRESADLLERMRSKTPKSQGQAAGPVPNITDRTSKYVAQIAIDDDKKPELDNNSSYYKNNDVNLTLFQIIIRVIFGILMIISGGFGLLSFLIPINSPGFSVEGIIFRLAGILSMFVTYLIFRFLRKPI